MTKITRNPLPAPLRPEDLSGKMEAVLQVKDVLVDQPTDKNRRGKATVVIPWGFENKGLYLNATSIDHAVTGMKSDESDEWKDKLLPVVVVTSEYEDPQTHKKTMTPKIWVAEPAQWARILKAHKPLGVKPD